MSHLVKTYWDPLCRWLLRNWVYLIALHILLLLDIGMYAFYRNGECGTKYELSFIWAGIGCLTTTAATLMYKYKIDSQNNSVNGVMPYTSTTTVKSTASSQTSGLDISKVVETIKDAVTKEEK